MCVLLMCRKLMIRILTHTVLNGFANRIVLEKRVFSSTNFFFPFVLLIDFNSPFFIELLVLLNWLHSRNSE